MVMVQTIREALANVLGGLLIACMASAAIVSLSFYRQALTFARAQLHRPYLAPPYALFLATGIWLCSTGTVLAFSDGILIRLGFTESPLFAGGTFVAHLLAIAGNAMIAAGYVLHYMAWHSVTKPHHAGLPWRWIAFVAIAAIAGSLWLWASNW